MKIKLIVAFILFAKLLFADEYISPELDCCIQNSKKLSAQIVNQEKILTSINNIYQTIGENRDTIINVVKVQNLGKEEKSCDMCGVIGAFLGAFISALVSLFIYKQGERNVTKRQENEILDFGEDIFILSKAIANSSNTQIESIDKFIKSTKKELYKAHVLEIVPYNQIERIRSFDIDKVKKAFKLLKIDNKDFVKFYNQLDYLYEVYKAVHEDYRENTSEFVTKFSNDFLQMRQEILADIADYNESLREKKLSDSDIYKYLDNLMVEYLSSIHGQLVPDINYDYENLIFKLITDLLESHRDSEFLKIILRKLQKAKEFYISVIGANTHFIKSLEDKIESYKKATNALNEINNKLSQHYAS